VCLCVAGCQKVTYFLLKTCTSLFALRSRRPDCSALCAVYTAFAFDKVNQKFFNPFCIQANIDRWGWCYTHTYIFARREDHQYQIRVSSLYISASEGAKAKATLSPRLIRTFWRCKVNFMNAKLYVFVFLFLNLKPVRSVELTEKLPSSGCLKIA